MAPVAAAARVRIYRIRARYQGRRLPWRVMEVRGDMSVAAFDRYLRTVFLYERPGRRSAFLREEAALYTLDPAGPEPAATVADLFRDPPDRLAWVFDLEHPEHHRLMLTAVHLPERTRTYPAVVRQNAPEYRTCACGVTPATWFCDTCGREQGMLVPLCDD
ncbi:MAG: hypothetical protein OWV35_04455, partial [Firmicutes bacterium]|nr:hypothetical protein [Bacillota bacterium]